MRRLKHLAGESDVTGFQDPEVQRGPKGSRWQDLHLDNDAPRMRMIGKGDKERLVPLLPDAVKALE